MLSFLLLPVGMNYFQPIPVRLELQYFNAIGGMLLYHSWGLSTVLVLVHYFFSPFRSLQTWLKPCSDTGQT